MKGTTPKKEQSADRKNIFVANSIFPDAAAVFTAKPLTLDDVRAIEVIYVRRPSMELRLRDITQRLRNRPPRLPLTVIAACETPEIADRVEKRWEHLDPPFRLCTGLWTSDGKFDAIRPL